MSDPFLHEYFSRFGHPTVRPDAPLSIAFLIGSTDISGGTYVILQHALQAQRSGADVTIVHMYEHRPEYGAWHAALTELPLVALEDAADLEFDLVVATMWRTVYELPRLRCAHAVYFVQSVESRFYGGRPESWAPPLAALTYTFDLPVITIARWIQAYLAFEHRRPAFLVHNGIRKDLYTPIGPTAVPDSDSRLRVARRGTVDVPMKNVEESIELRALGGADEVWLLTSSEVPEHQGVDRVFSRVPIEQTPAIYRSCSVLLKLSHVEGMYGPPLEMFHCGGTVITYDVTGHDEFVHDGVNGIVVPMYDRQRRDRGDPQGCVTGPTCCEICATAPCGRPAAGPTGSSRRQTSTTRSVSSPDSPLPTTRTRCSRSAARAWSCRGERASRPGIRRRSERTVVAVSSCDVSPRSSVGVSCSST